MNRRQMLRLLGSSLGASERHVVVGAIAFEIVWLSQEKEQLEKRHLFEAIQDLDVYENRLAVLGTQRGENGFIGTDGAIAWTTSLQGELGELKPILYSISGPGARLMDNCSGHEFGALRFLPDGSLVIAPGAEPGVYLYDPAGVLTYTWPTEPLGVDATVCDFDLKESTRLGADYVERAKWDSRFTVIDDVLPLVEGPGLLLRYAVDGEIRWRLAVLHRDSAATMYEVPVTSPSLEPHLRGDVRGEKIVLLRTQGGDRGKPPDAEPILYVIDFPR